MSSSDAILTHPKRVGRCVEHSTNWGGDGQFLLNRHQECPGTLNTKAE